ACVHQHAGPGRAGSVDNIAVAGDPADIGGTPEDVVVTVVEDPLECLLDVKVIACGRVLDALGFTGGAARVEDGERRFAIERRGGAFGRRIFHQLVPAMIAPSLHGDLGATGSASAGIATEHDALFDGGTFSKRFVDGFFER